MRRRKRHEERLNHEAWAIPYADLVTLLLAFFVVMYAVSVVNEGKYRVMSESIIEAFNGSSRAIAPLPPSKVPPHTLQPSLTRPTKSSGTPLAPIKVPIPQRRTPPTPAHAVAGAGRPGNLERIEGQVREALQPLIDKQLVIVRRRPSWLEIEIRTDILFPSGVAQLSPSADKILHGIASILAPFGNPLRVEGFTDNVPISTDVYPSNWELSAARAASVARLFATHGVAATRLGIIGWGEVRPVADNATAEGRNRNRRVVVVVLGNQKKPSRISSDAAHVGQLASSPATMAAPLPTVYARASDAPSAVTGPHGALPEVPVISAAPSSGPASTGGGESAGQPVPHAVSAE